MSGPEPILTILVVDDEEMVLGLCKCSRHPMVASKVDSQVLGPKQITLGVLAAYGSLPDRGLAGPRPFDHCGYGYWRKVIEEHAKLGTGCPEVREAIKVGSNILIRSVEHDCRRSRTLIRGTANPLELNVGTDKIEILEVSFNHPTGKYRHLVRGTIYARTAGAVSVEVARSLASHLRDSIGSDEVNVELRSDAWFIRDCGFPALFPFEEQSRPPSIEEFSHTRFVSCDIVARTNKPMPCFEATSRP